MPDRIIGQPTNLTTVTDNGAGFCRVTFAPWELDWEFFAAITPGVDFVANTTAGNSSGVTASGGAENLGYWFDTTRAFPGGWASGDRFTPQRQAAILQHANFAAGVAAMANDDVFLVWYQNAANRRYWFEGILFAGVGGSVWGMPSGMQMAIEWVSGTIQYTLNQGGMAVRPTIRNLFLSGYSVNDRGVRYVPNNIVGQKGPGVRVTRCVGYGLQDFVRVDFIEAGQVSRADNCVAVGGGAFNSGVSELYFNVSLRNNVGFNVFGVAGANNVAAECATCFAAAAWTNCADTDGTLPVVPSNLRNQDMRTQLRFFYDLARPGNKAFPLDFRIHQDSVLVGAGAAIAGLTNDGDGQLRPAVPSIGAYEPYSTCYAPAAEIVRGTGKRGAGA